MTECDPKFPFAQQRTFTFADAARAANKGYESFFGGKWHLGAFFNDSNVPSSPIFHGFDHMNATVEVAPTATANCGCNADWEKTCNFGHYGKHTHCSGGIGPAGDAVPNGCCFNYWWEDPGSPHGVTNLTNPSYDDDASYLAESFEIFLDSRQGSPFAAQISFHSCHIPYIGTAQARRDCQNGKTCRATNGHGNSPGNFTDFQLDFYSCMTELDGAVGRVLAALDSRGYYENTFIWFTTDNGPEKNCGPAGFCEDAKYRTAPGDAGPLRGRKRDIWEGGHRVPTIVSWPAVQTGKARVSWDTVVTQDFLPTMMEALVLDRPASQKDWGFDGKSIMPILRGESWPERGIAWLFDKWSATSDHGYRQGKWMYVHGSRSCNQDDCKGDMLFDLEVDLGQKHDLSGQHAEVLANLKASYSTWYDSVAQSRDQESFCNGKPTPSPTPSPIPSPPPSHGCDWHMNTGLGGSDIKTVEVSTKEECCDECKATAGCIAADFNKLKSDVFRCHLKESFSPKDRSDGSIACVPSVALV